MMFARRICFASIVLFALTATSVPAAPCDCTPPGCPCACNCSHYGMTTCVLSKTCLLNQKATCTCSETTCSSSCSTNPNQGLSNETLFYNFDVVAGLLPSVGQHLKGIDADWSIIVESGLVGTGTPLTETYEWSSGVDLGVFLDALAAEFSACAEIDWANEVVTFRVEGNCS